MSIYRKSSVAITVAVVLAIALGHGDASALGGRWRRFISGRTGNDINVKLEGRSIKLKVGKQGGYVARVILGNPKAILQEGPGIVFEGGALPGVAEFDFARSKIEGQALVLRESKKARSGERPGRFELAIAFAEPIYTPDPMIGKIESITFRKKGEHFWSRWKTVVAESARDLKEAPTAVEKTPIVGADARELTRLLDLWGDPNIATDGEDYRALRIHALAWKPALWPMLGFHAAQKRWSPNYRYEIDFAGVEVPIQLFDALVGLRQDNLRERHPIFDRLSAHPEFAGKLPPPSGIDP